MPFQLELKHEELHYTGNFARPMLELWGNAGVIVKGMLGALGPHGVTVQNIQANNGPNVSEIGFTANVPGVVGTLKVGFDKIEFKFANFSEVFFESLPKTMTDLTAWMVQTAPDFKFGSHRFYHYTHSLVKDSTPEEALKDVNAREVKSAGIAVGSGAIFNHVVPSKSWETQLLVDRSRHVIGGLFISLEIQIHTGDISYPEIVSDGRKYLSNALAELNLSMPEAVSA